jgi:N-acetylglucosamine kinase
LQSVLQKFYNLYRLTRSENLQGLSLSGCEQEETNQELVNGLKDSYPNLSKVFAVGSDTEGSVATTSNCGGITCIAGTGSNTLLINPDGTRVQCGGWGNLLGDEGGGRCLPHYSRHL